MKKLLCVIISAIIVAGTAAVLPVGSFAASKKAKKVSLKKTSVTLKIKTVNGKKTYGSTTVKLKKIKGVTVKKTTYKSSNKKIAVVSKKGKVTAKKAGNAKITVKVTYKYKKKTYTKSFSFKVTVKKVKDSQTEIYPPKPQEETEPAQFEHEAAEPLNTLPEIEPKTGSFTDKAFLNKLSAFSNKLYKLCDKKAGDKNYSMSPISVYMALSMLYSIGDDGVKSDIQNLVGMSDEDFSKTGELFVSLLNKSSYMGSTVRTLSLTNSIWVDSGEEVNSDALSALANDYYCSAYKTPFASNNSAANSAVREFVKQQTNGLIDQNFNLTPDTLFALINTLYFKDVWDLEREQLSTEKRNFTTPDATVEREFLIGKYVPGQVAQTDKAYYFYTKTSGGYKAKFILPKDGYTLSEVMTADSLNQINTQSDFKSLESGTKHFTRCIFPSFKIESDTPLKEIFAENGLLPNSFTAFDSPLTEKELCVSDIKHKVVIDVSKTGIEGAAVTVIVSKASAAFPSVPEKYHNFVVDKSFGFIITDPSDVVLFEGQVIDPKQ